MLPRWPGQVELREIAMVPVVLRRVEQAHAVIKSVNKRPAAKQPAAVCAEA